MAMQHRVLLLMLLVGGVGAFGDPSFRAVMGGADVVAYFTLPRGTEGTFGSPDHAVQHAGYTFWFSTPENAQRFQKNPLKYTPAWGGFCAWGVAREVPPQWPWSASFMGPPCNPATGWAVHNGTLYCALSSGIMDRFLSDADNFRRGNERWRAWYGALNAGPFNTHCYQTTTSECVHSGYPFPNRTTL
eukprot:Sspe_Gene.16936::Locus_5987_Transcript_1_1_Confidence_1.000_Length_861::g.16936::m.16936